MIIVSYDITNTKTRTRFMKFLRKFGRRMQYSVYEIENSSTVLANVVNEIKRGFAEEFEETDSVCLFNLSSSCKIERYGYAAQEDEILIIVR